MVPLAPREDTSVIRYAESDDDAIAIHRFLCVIAQPAMRCAHNFQKSATEVWRVCQEEVGLMAIHNGVLVGTMGIIAPTWWYGDGNFMTDRWHFMLPEHQNGPLNTLLIDEAKQIATLAGCEFIHQGKIRGPRNGMSLMMPRVLTAAE